MRLFSGAFLAALCMASAAASSSTILDKKTNLLRKAVQVKDGEGGGLGACALLAPLSRILWLSFATGEPSTSANGPPRPPRAPPAPTSDDAGQRKYPVRGTTASG